MAMRFWSFDLSPTLTRDVTFSPFRRAIWPFLGGGAGYFAFAWYGVNITLLNRKVKRSLLVFSKE